MTIVVLLYIYFINNLYGMYIYLDVLQKLPKYYFLNNYKFLSIKKNVNNNDTYNYTNILYYINSSN